MGKLISVQDAAKRLGVCDQTLKNWAKDGTIQLKGMGKGSRKFWVDEDVIAAISDNAADVERMKEDINRMQRELHNEWRKLDASIRDTKRCLRLVNIGSARLHTTEFFKAFTWAMGFMGVIKEREEDVINLILDGWDLSMIGDKYGISDERVLQVFLAACSKVRRSGNLKQYYEEAEYAKRELNELRIENEGLKAALQQFKPRESEDFRKRLVEKYGEDFVENYQKLKDMCSKLSIRLREQNLSVRTLNILIPNDIETVGELVQYVKTDLLKFRNFGRKSLTELDDFLESLGLCFGMDVEAIKSDMAAMRMIIGDDAEREA